MDHSQNIITNLYFSTIFIKRFLLICVVKMEKKCPLEADSVRACGTSLKVQTLSIRIKQ
jgi:hypothetical protein